MTGVIFSFSISVWGAKYKIWDVFKNQNLLKQCWKRIFLPQIYHRTPRIFWAIMRLESRYMDGKKFVGFEAIIWFEQSPRPPLEFRPWQPHSLRQRYRGISEAILYVDAPSTRHPIQRMDVCRRVKMHMYDKLHTSETKRVSESGFIYERKVQLPNSWPGNGIL